MRSVYFETYGCSANQAHSETMESSLASNGFRMTKDIRSSDVIVINTCIVKSPTENKIRERIKFFVSKYPNKTLLIAGCASDVGLFKDIAPNAVFISSHKSEDLAKSLIGTKKKTNKKMRKNPFVNITEIASGCLGRCSYCVVKLARGDLKSRDTKDIEKEVRGSLKDGCKEVWLTSQDCGCFGLDMGKNLAELLKKVSGTKGAFRIRVGMMNPSHVKAILGDLIEVYKSPKVYKFIHVPVQSGSDRILQKMRRGYKTGDFERIIREFRKEFPELTVSTDVIVGFPGETEKDFRETLELLERIKPDVVNVSKFGARPKTEASEMKPLDNKLIKKRSKIISDFVKKIGLERNEKWLGKESKILITETGKLKNQFMGRNESYKPVVVESEEDLMGRFLRVKITKVGYTYLAAEII